MRKFVALLFSDKNGVPDIGECVVAAVVIALIAGSFTIHPFPLKGFSEAVCTLIPLYKISRGDWRRP